MQRNFRRTLFKVNLHNFFIDFVQGSVTIPSDVGDNDNVQMTTITKSKSVTFSFLSRPTYPVLLLIFYLQQEIKLEWPY